MSTSSAPNHPTPTSTPPKKLLLTVAFLSLLLFAIIDSQTSHRIQIAFQSLLAWISTHLIAGIFALITAYALAAVAFVPGSILTLGSGFVYGKAFGLGCGVAIATGLVFAGASCGAILSFLVGRYLLREWVGETLVDKYPVVGALDQALEQQGFQIFLLLRLSPIIPFNIINYIGGVTAISLKDYTRALIGILPGTVLYCFIGASAGSLSETQNGTNGPAAVAVIGDDNGRIILSFPDFSPSTLTCYLTSSLLSMLVVVGIVLGLLAVYFMLSHAKKEFDKIVGLQER
ncbi:hypothetical protein ACHAWX_002662 [Stephanocyclus meneghinianus]